ncbi:MAG: hypothetical protein ABIH08_03920 [Candidatus Omnitrophota bacterium]
MGRAQRELEKCIEVQFEALNSNINSCNNRLEDQIIHLAGAHTKELRECLDVQFEQLNITINSCSDRIEKQIIHLLRVHTKELRESMEVQFKILEKVARNLSRDLAILSDIIDKNTQTYISQTQKIVKISDQSSKSIK